MCSTWRTQPAAAAAVNRSIDRLVHCCGIQSVVSTLGVVSVSLVSKVHRAISSGDAVQWRSIGPPQGIVSPDQGTTARGGVSPREPSVLEGTRLSPQPVGGRSFKNVQTFRVEESKFRKFTCRQYSFQRFNLCQEDHSTVSFS